MEKIDGPPIKIRSLIELAWGLSSTFSHDPHQREMGTSIREKIFDIFTSHQKTKFEKESKITYQPTATTKIFLDNVVLSMSETIRNIGFTRNNHQNSLHALSKEYQNTEKYYNDLASLTSFKESGIAPKMISFLGGGGLLSTVTEFGEKIFPKKATESINTLNATIQTITDSEIAEQANNQFSNVAESVIDFPGLFIVVFVLFGIISLAIFNVGAIVYKKSKLSSEKERILCEQKKYYVKKYRRNMALILINFHNDLEKLASECYGIIYEESFDDLSGIVIENDEYEWLYKKTKFQDSWDPEPEDNGTYPTDDENSCKEHSKKNTTYSNQIEKKFNKTYTLNWQNLKREDKLWYFITYKILPTWFTPMHPEQETA